MWDTISQRIRFGAVAKRESRPSPEKLRAKTLLMKKVSAQVRLQSAEVINAQLVLNDFSEGGVKIFSPVSLQEGQEVAVTIAYPRTFYVRARVLSSYEAVMNPRVIQANPHPFRVWLAFDPSSDLERESIIQLVHEIQLCLRDEKLAQKAA